MNSVLSSECDLADVKVQVEILDEIWAKWLQNCETRYPDLNQNALIEELRKIIEDCSERAKRFESENIYHLLKFGEVRLLKGDFKGATKFYDQVILKDPAWSAFAHYNKAYCTIQMKEDGYIKRAIDDLKAVICKLLKYKKKCVFTDIFVHCSTVMHDA